MGIILGCIFVAGIILGLILDYAERKINKEKSERLGG